MFTLTSVQVLSVVKMAPGRGGAARKEPGVNKNPARARSTMRGFLNNFDLEIELIRFVIEIPVFIAAIMSTIGMLHQSGNDPPFLVGSLPD